MEKKMSHLFAYTLFKCGSNCCGVWRASFWCSSDIRLCLCLVAAQEEEEKEERRLLLQHKRMCANILVCHVEILYPAEHSLVGHYMDWALFTHVKKKKSYNEVMQPENEVLCCVYYSRKGGNYLSHMYMYI